MGASVAYALLRGTSASQRGAVAPHQDHGKNRFVFAGGGSLGAIQVGMLRDWWRGA